MGNSTTAGNDIASPSLAWQNSQNQGGANPPNNGFIGIRKALPDKTFVSTLPTDITF